MIRLLLMLFLCTPLSAQMDTTISKDEYYELVYQLEKSRTYNNMLKTRVTEMEWIIYSNDAILKIYQERLLAMEIVMASPKSRKTRKKR